MKDKTKKNIQTFIKIIISVLILYFLIDKIGFSNILGALSKANYLILILVFPLKIVALTLNTFNINIFLKGIKKKVNFWKLFLSSNLAWSMGLILPGRLGELTLIYFLNQHDVTLGESTAITILDKISTFIVFSVLSILGILKYFSLNLAIKFGTIVLFILIIALFFLTNKKTRKIVKSKFLKSYSHLFTGFNKSFRLILNKKKLFIFNLIITSIKWFFSFWIIKVIFYSLGGQVSIIDLSFITSIAMLASLIPISIAGLGVRESIAVYLFSLIGVKPEITIIAYLINTSFNYFFGFVIIIFNLDKINLTKIKLKKIRQISH